MIVGMIVPVLVPVPVVVPVPVPVPVLVPVIVIVIVRVIVRVIGGVLMMMPGGVRRRRCRGMHVAPGAKELALGGDLEIGRSDPVLRDLRDLQPRTAGADRIEGVADDLHGHAEIEQRTEHHVARRTAGAVDVQMLALHRRTASRATLTAAIAAPTPLSMLTTVIPGAHALSIEASATRPSIETP